MIIGVTNNSLSLLLNSKINCDLQKNQLLMIKSSIFELKMTYIRLKNNLFLCFLDVSNLFLLKAVLFHY
ncbi:hypothetical protein CBG25_04200 [Arsenophonus sp. ENCA]|nr:hypothetical protein CBG25_04200 [Arsenophonus sp. ENCA]